MTSQHQYMNREQNAVRLARKNATKRRWLYVGVMVAFLAALLPFALSLDLLSVMLGIAIALAVFASALHSTTSERAFEFEELDADGYSKALAITQASEPCCVLVASWIDGGELFLTYSDLAELQARQPMFDLADAVGGHVRGDGGRARAVAGGGAAQGRVSGAGNARGQA